MERYIYHYFSNKILREEIEMMYLDTLLAYQHLITDLQKGWSIQYASYELDLIKRLGGEDRERENAEQNIAECRQSLQRLIQMLSNPGKFIYTNKWSCLDLIYEINKLENQQISNPQCELELDRWLNRQVNMALAKYGMKLTNDERTLRKREAWDFRRRYKLQRRLRDQFVSSAINTK